MTTDSFRGALNRDQASRTLEQVRRRYGISGTEPRVRWPLRKSEVRTEQQSRPRMVVPQTPTNPSSMADERTIVGAPLDLGWSDYQVREVTPVQTASTEQRFDYLIQIAECNTSLHCEIRAVSEADARLLLGQIPNLLHWRQLAREELAAMRKNEQACEALDDARRPQREALTNK